MNLTTNIAIPRTTPSTPIGEVLVSLFSVMEEMKANNESVTWDFQVQSQCHPLLLASLFIIKDCAEGNISVKNLKDSSEIAFGMPNCKFERTYAFIDQLQSELLTSVASQIKSKACGWQPSPAISYLISELTCNIQEHSHCSHGYLFAFSPDNDDSLSICIADDGISIYGSYLTSDKVAYNRIIGADQAEALKCSIKGLSTKNRPENESRGYGLSTNLNMIVNGLGGDFLILSGKALYLSEGNSEQFVNLPDGLNWDGTMIFAKIPLKQDREFNLYDFIE